MNKSTNQLRAISLRVETTSPEQLPHIVPSLTNALLSCREVLSGERRIEHASDSVDPVRRFGTQLSTLLGKESPGSRWAAVVLIKTCIEVGGWNILQDALQWIQGLLNTISKPGPAILKKVTILTLTRIFVLTHDYPSLSRVITTPSLPSFITACLNTVTLHGTVPKKFNLATPLLDTVLQAFTKLLPAHPSVFRPFIGQLKTLLAPLVAPTPSTIPADLSLHILNNPSKIQTGLAQNLYTLLPHCAPKDSKQTEWPLALKAVLHHAHETADAVFRAVIEERSSGTMHYGTSANAKSYGDMVHGSVNGELPVPEWRGIYAGTERLVGLLELVQAYVANPSHVVVPLRLDTILSLLSRILLIFGPSTSSASGSDTQPRLNPEVSRDEREGLWAGLPSIHATAIDTISLLMSRIGFLSVNFAPGIMELLVWVLHREKSYSNVKRSVYRVMSQMIHAVGPSMSKSDVASISSFLVQVCQDIILEFTDGERESQSTGDQGSKPGKKTQRQGDADAYTKSTTKNAPRLRTRNRDQTETTDLLFVILSRIPSHQMPRRIREQMDRAAVLAQHEDAMFASLLNPLAMERNKTSILPLLARAHPYSLKAEALLQPRMPVIQIQRYTDGNTPSENVEMQDVIQDDGARPSNGVYTTLEPSNAPYVSTRTEGFSHIPVPDPTSTEFSMPMENLRAQHDNFLPSRAEVSIDAVTLQSPKRARDDSAWPGSLVTQANETPISKRIRLPNDNNEVLDDSMPEQQGQSDLPYTGLGSSLGTRSNPPGFKPTTATPINNDDVDSDDSSDVPPIVLDSDTESESSDEKTQ